MAVHPLVLESIINLLIQDGSIWTLPEFVPVLRACPAIPLDPVCIVEHAACVTCGGDNVACGGDDKIVLLRKILNRIAAGPIGKGPFEPYRPGDNAVDVERKILQVLCRA